MDEGYYLDDGTKIDKDAILIPDLCISCKKNQKGEVACNLIRIDQMNEIQKGEMFCCFAYEPKNANVDKESLFMEMEKYLSKKK